MPFLRSAPFACAVAVTWLAAAACGGTDASIAPLAPDANDSGAAVVPDGGAAALDGSPGADATVADAAGSDAGPGPEAGYAPTPPAPRVLGYYTGSSSSYDSVSAFHATVNMVASDTYVVHDDGSITGGDDRHVTDLDRQYGIATFACISNFDDAAGDFSAALAHAAMVTHEDAFVAAAVAVGQSGFDGINVDFESLAYSANVADDRAAFTKMVHDLATKLHAVGLRVVVSVPAKSADSPKDTWTYPYDLAALGADVDFIQLMTYDEHGPGWSAPGPVAGVDWTEAAVAYAASVASPAKVLVGLPAYGYDWDLTASNPGAGTYTGTSVAWTDVAAVLARPGAAAHFDAATQSPYVDYTANDGHQHELWFENAQSVAAKTKLVTTHGLAGLSMWALGDEDAAFWQAAMSGL